MSQIHKTKTRIVSCGCSNWVYVRNPSSELFCWLFQSPRNLFGTWAGYTTPRVGRQAFGLGHLGLVLLSSDSGRLHYPRSWQISRWPRGARTESETVWGTKSKKSGWFGQASDSCCGLSLEQNNLFCGCSIWVYVPNPKSRIVSCGCLKLFKRWFKNI